MKYAIISDIHDNIVNLEKCLKWCNANNIGAIICCGDVTNSGTLHLLAARFEKDIYLVQGNIELYEEEEVEVYLNIKYLGKYGIIEIDNFKVGVCHEPFYIDKLLEREGVKLIFYGHTHKPWIEDKKGVKLINPGTLGGVFQKASFAVWESGEGGLELILLERIEE